MPFSEDFIPTDFARWLSHGKRFHAAEDAGGRMAAAFCQPARLLRFHVRHRAKALLFMGQEFCPNVRSGITTKRCCGIRYRTQNTPACNAGLRASESYVSTRPRCI